MGTRVSKRDVTVSKEVDFNSSLNPSMSALNLFPQAPMLSSVDHAKRRAAEGADEWQGRVIKVVHLAAASTAESAAGILLCM